LLLNSTAWIQEDLVEVGSGGCPFPYWQFKAGCACVLSIRLIGWREYIEQDSKCKATIDDNVR
jgi:hypothetical protein